MKKKTVIILVITAALIVMGYSFYNSIFPKAKTIKVPAGNEVTSMTLIEGNKEYPIDLSQYEKLKDFLDKAVPTRKQSVNDTPNVSPYYRIDIKTGSRVLTVYIYEQGVGTYIEIPYEGIYRSDKGLMEYVKEQN